MEIRKSVFTVMGAITVVTTILLGANEFRLKARAEDRQLFYASLGQLAGGTQVRPDIATAALLQLKRLGDYSQGERPMLASIVSAYLNETARYPVSYYERSGMARPDIQISLQILSDLISDDPAIGQLVTLREVDLRHVQLRDADLSGVIIRGSHFAGASIVDSNLSNCDLTGSKLVQARFVGTTFADCSLDLADFSFSDVRLASFCGKTSFRSANFRQAINLEQTKCPPKP